MKETSVDMTPGPRRDFWRLVEQEQRKRPELTGLEAFQLVRSTAHGAALWDTINDKADALDAITNSAVGKRQRVEIRKHDPGALTGKQIADDHLQELQRGYVAKGMTPINAWRETLQSKEGQEWARIRESKYAHLTTVESAERVMADVETLKVDIAKALAGQPVTFHDAVVALQKREQIDYPTALARAVADPANAALVERYNREGC